MTVEKYQGIINTIDCRQQPGATWYRFSTLEIGDKVLQQIISSDKFMVWLTVGAEVAVYIDGKEIVALERSDGKLFVVKHKKPGIFSLIVGLALTPLGGIGLIILLPRYVKGKRYNTVENIVSKYPNYENLGV